MGPGIRSFWQYLKEQEEHESGMDTPLKGYSAENVIARIEVLMKYLTDKVRFGVPSDSLGSTTTYRDANAAIQKIKDIQHYYESKGEDVRFYCWSIAYNGAWDATQSLKKKIEEAGGFGEGSMNINLKKVISYLENNPEDSDNIGTISISIDAMRVRKVKAGSSPDSKEPTEDKEEENEKPEVDSNATSDVDTETAKKEIKIEKTVKPAEKEEDTEDIG